MQDSTYTEANYILKADFENYGTAQERLSNNSIVAENWVDLALTPVLPWIDSNLKQQAQLPADNFDPQTVDWLDIADLLMETKRIGATQLYLLEQKAKGVAIHEAITEEAWTQYCAQNPTSIAVSTWNRTVIVKEAATKGSDEFNGSPEEYLEAVEYITNMLKATLVQKVSSRITTIKLPQEVKTQIDNTADEITRKQILKRYLENPDPKYEDTVYNPAREMLTNRLEVSKRHLDALCANARKAVLATST